MSAPSIIEITRLLRPVVCELDGFLGAILQGSVSAGMQDETSDYDVQLVFSDAALARHSEYQDIVIPGAGRKVDLWSSSLSELMAIDPQSDEAKDYVNSIFLFDKEGVVKAAVRSFVAIAPERIHERVAARLDSYYNALYRSLKCRRHGYTLGFYAMATESAKLYLDLIYALNGTIAPFINRAPFLLKRLEKLPAPPDVLSRMLESICRDASVKTQIALFDMTSIWFETLGYRDVQDAWEGVLENEVDAARKSA